MQKLKPIFKPKPICEPSQIKPLIDIIDKKKKKGVY